MLKSNMLIIIMIISAGIFNMASAQKVKVNKIPIAWSYVIEPSNPLPENIKSNMYVVEPVEGIEQDSLDSWSQKYLALKAYPLNPVESDGDLMIKFTNERLEITDVKTDVDFNDMNSSMGELNVVSRLVVEDKAGNKYIDEEIRYAFDDEDSTRIKLAYLMYDPVFNMKFKMTKKPDKREEMVRERIRKYNYDLLLDGFEKAGLILKGNFLSQREDVYSAIYTFKDKSFDSFNTKAEEVAEAINSLSAFSKKKRKSLDEIKPLLTQTAEEWKTTLASTSDAEVQKYIEANLSTVHLLLSNIDQAENHFKNIPETDNIENTGTVTGNFNYYLKGLKAALDIVKDYSKEQLSIYQP